MRKAREEREKQQQEQRERDRQRTEFRRSDSNTSTSSGFGRRENSKWWIGPVESAIHPIHPVIRACRRTP